MRERTLAALLFAAFLCWHWGQMEEPAVTIGDLAVLCAAAVGPAVLWAAGRRVWAAGGVLAGLVAAVAVATGFYPWERDHPFYLSRLWDTVDAGANDWFETTTPMDPVKYVEASADARLILFALIAGVAWLLIAARRPLAAIAVAFLGFAMPTSLLDLEGDALRAGLFLLISLAALAACRERPLPRRAATALQITMLGTLAVGLALVVAAAPGVSKEAFLDWKTWDPLAKDAPRVDVSYVWDQSYGPLRWPKKRTVVFEVKSNRPLYWRAAVLDEFNVDRWQARPVVQQFYGSGTSVIGIPESIRPPRAVRPEQGDVVEATFTVRGLADSHLLTPGQPLSYQLESDQAAQLDLDGTVHVNPDPDDGFTYTSRGYVPDPEPSDLASIQLRYPSAVQDAIRIGNERIPQWGSGETAVPVALARSLVDASALVWDQSGAVGAGSPYAAVVSVESYFRDEFTYDRAPQYRPGMPVLADFMTQTKRGYCQMFAGSMALVLRLHGIPARVAVGFTTGSETEPGRGQYVVNDRNAHAWVEVYFPNYGWLPFDPTPGRTLPTAYSSASADQDAFTRGIASIPGPRGVAPETALAKQILALPNGAVGASGFKRGVNDGTANPRRGTRVISFTEPGEGGSFLRWLITALGVVVAVLAVAKLAAVRWRYLRHGPRATAAAAYHDLATYAGDQGVRVPPTMTFEQLAGQLKDAYGIDATTFAATASAARYAPEAVAEPAGRRVRGQVRDLKRQIRSQLSLRDRLVGMVRLRTAIARGAYLD